MSGINPYNLLTIEPQSRNPNLADALKRIGLAEKTGRGIDRIYEGSMRYGRPLPDYSGSNSRYVRVYISRIPTDMDFTKMISIASKEMERDFTIEELLILHYLKDNKVVTLNKLAELFLINKSKLQNSLNNLVNLGYLKSSGNRQETRFKLNENKYRKIPSESGLGEIYDLVSREDIISFIKNNGGEATRREISEKFSVSKPSAYRLLKKLVDRGDLELIKNGRSSKYRLR